MIPHINHTGVIFRDCAACKFAGLCFDLRRGGSGCGQIQRRVDHNGIGALLHGKPCGVDMHGQGIGVLFGLLQRIGSGIASLSGSIQKIRCGNLKKLSLRLIEKADRSLFGQNGAQPLCKERKGIALLLGKGGKHNAFLQRIPMQSIAIFQSAALRDIVHRSALQRDLGSILRAHALQGVLGK